MTLTTQFVCLMMLLLVISVVVETGMSGVHKVSQSNTEFANALYSELAKTSGSSSIFFSPLSIHVILALAYVGAKGKTAEQMASGLHLPADVNVVESDFQLLLQGIATTSENATLEIANKVYLRKGKAFKDDFHVAATQKFFAEVGNVDFRSRAETAKIINEWMSGKTQGKIRNIVRADDLDTNTVSILVNALYFKGTWEYPFNKELTTSSPFYITANTTKNIDMMQHEAFFVLVKNEHIGADILELPYKDNTTSLVVILPFKIDGLSEVEKKLQTTKLSSIFESLILKKEIEVRLPRFKLEKRFVLSECLRSLGMTEMFSTSAEFSGMSDSRPRVSQVLHKAVIEINEEGSLETSVSETEYTDEPDRDSTQLVIDHPFVFLVRNKIFNTVIFMGRFTNTK